MNLNTFLRTGDGQVSIQNIGIYERPTHSAASKAPGLRVAAFRSPISTDPRYSKAFTSVKQFLARANVTKSSLSFPSDPTELFSLKEQNSLETKGRFKIWNIVFADEGIIFEFIEDVYVPNCNDSPMVMGKVTIDTPFFDGDIIASAYDQYLETKHVCLVSVDSSCPQMKYYTFQVAEKENESDQFTVCGDMQFTKNGKLSGTFTIS